LHCFTHPNSGIGYYYYLLLLVTCVGKTKLNRYRTRLGKFHCV